MSQPHSVMVTGASRGVGRDLAEFFLSAGYSVIGCSRHFSDLSHKNYKHFYLDIANEADVIKMFKEISLVGGVDVLINNAAISHSSLNILTSGQTANEVIKTNLLGNFLVSREAVKLMRRNNFGRIINFSSINVELSSRGSSLYSASKAAVDCMSRVLSFECADSDITINSVGLSLVKDSGMLGSLASGATKEKLSHLAKPAILEINEIVHVINFLISSLAKNITGQVIYFGGV